MIFCFSPAAHDHSCDQLVENHSTQKNAKKKSDGPKKPYIVVGKSGEEGFKLTVEPSKECAGIFATLRAKVRNLLDCTKKLFANKRQKDANSQRKEMMDESASLMERGDWDEEEEEEEEIIAREFHFNKSYEYDSDCSSCSTLGEEFY